MTFRNILLMSEPVTVGAFNSAKSCSLIFSLGSHCIVWCFPLLWSAAVITLSLVLWQPIETHSRGGSSRTMFFFSDWEYMKIMYVICKLRDENERDLRINEHLLSSSKNMASKKFRPVWDLKIEDRRRDRFHVLYFARYIIYFTCLLGKYRNSRQFRNWRIYHHGWHCKGVPSRGFCIYLRHQQWKRRCNTAR